MTIEEAATELMKTYMYISFLFWKSRSAPAGLKPISTTPVPLLTLARCYVSVFGTSCDLIIFTFRCSLFP